MQRVRHLLDASNTNKILSKLTFSTRKTSTMASLETLNFDNLALRRLPIDPEDKNYVRGVANACFSKVMPTPVKNPATVAYSANAMALLDLPISELELKQFPEYLSGNKLLPGAEPAAHCYCGHQFGYFSGQLGDGAAMYLGEVINKKGERWEIQFKGAGKTPYSRTADGRKVMRSSIREFLCSEAMYYLNIPTTRAGSCVTSDTKVIRDIFYDGHPIEEKCTIILRIAPTFLRFGSFEIFKTLDCITGRCGPSVGRHDILHTMLDYTIEIFYPEVHEAHKESNESKYAEFFKQVVLRTAQLVAMWQCVGFCHGVLNTDNMSIIGLTIDYGPFGFMDMYNPDHICNGSDDNGRYSYRKQPEMCLWNLKKLAEAIEKALPLTVSLPLLELFEPEYKSCYLAKMRLKLGLIRTELADDSELIENLFDTMENSGADFTNTFRCFNILEVPGLPGHKKSFAVLKQKLVENCYPSNVLAKSLKQSMESRNIKMFLLFAKSSPEVAERMESSGINLKRVLENMEKASHLEELPVEKKRNQDLALWDKWLKLYVERLDKEVESKSDLKTLQALQRERVAVMNKNNPRYILRNYIAESAIVKAESGDYSEVKHVLKLLEQPFDDIVDPINQQDAVPCSSKTVDADEQSSKPGRSSFVEKVSNELPPDWAFDLRVT